MKNVSRYYVYVCNLFGVLINWREMCWHVYLFIAETFKNNDKYYY